MKRYLLAFTALVQLLSNVALGQCSLTNATSCVCRTSGQTTCDLKPDITISWAALQGYLSGPNENPQTGTQAGRLKISGSTPNIGYGPLEVRTADQAGLRHFVCGTDTFTVGGQTGFSCPNGQNPKQIIFQQVYRKQGNAMVRNERMAGSMTYHSAHSHYHVNDWTTMDLKLQDPSEPDPRKWPTVASGAKIGFCLMDYGACSTYPGHCRTSQEYNGGTALNSSSNFPNYGLYGNYGCGTNVQGISVGRTDIYSENLDMMWINVMDGLCNGNYWIVAEADPTNVFVEENDDNNYTAIPFSMTMQRPAGSGGSASILAPNGLRAITGSSVRLTATPGYSYLWSNGATTRSIDVTQAGTYSVTVTAPCGSLTSSAVNVSFEAPLAPPTGTGATVVGPASASLSAVGQGTELLWYNAPTGGTVVGTGSQFQTPVISSTTDYYVSTRSVSPGVNTYGAKTDRTGTTQLTNSARQWLIFNATEPFELASVKVYAANNGDRHFVLKDNVGNVIEERYVYVPTGTQRVQLNMKVPAGTGHMITAYDDNTEIVIDLHRDDSGVSYPYPVGGGLGSITGSTGGSSFYYYLYDWEVKTPDLVRESPRSLVTASVTEGVVLDLELMLQGPYDLGTGRMNDNLRTLGLIPSIEPFTALGFVHAGGGGGETLSPGLLAVTGDEAVVDWVLVELRNANQPSQVMATKSCIVTRAGQVYSTTGSLPRFSVLNGNYFVSVRHRNHLGCMTATALPLTALPMNIDLKQPSTAVHGTEARRLDSNGVAMLWAGNTRMDDRSMYTGQNNDRDPILAAVGGVVPTNTASGYLSADTNLDGVVKYTGGGNDRDIILNNIGGVIPTNIRIEQLP
ncbi:MAG: hypothetical protein JNL52_15885 [Flavobacteriales bacterium]|nr:hypothetical protein [Flavobacteriales bacterium]